MKSTFILVLIFISVRLVSQSKDSPKVVDVGDVSERIVIDGVLDEKIWSKVHPATDFLQYFPTDTLIANAQTEIYLVADNENLYVGIKCYAIGNNWIVSSLRRDYRAGGNDNITLVFDTFDDRTNGIFFGINPEGVVREGVVTNGGNERRDFSESWDNRWRGEAQKYDGYYTAEMSIPFSTLRYDTKSEKWGFLAYRFDTQSNELSTWPGTPQNQVLFNLAAVGEMRWQKKPPPSKKQISIIPFVSGAVNRDYVGGIPTKSKFDIGGDAKFGITSGLNLDLTVNPDFSQVEVDRQITNLSRFELFFPERRQFFIENADLFGQFGFSTINPFFSRRIGVARDSSTNQTVQNRIYGGLRLSGKINPKTRIGVMNMQTASNDVQGLPAANYGILALQRNVLERSNISFLVVNKQSANANQLGLNAYNRVLGMDFNYANSDNTWAGKVFTHGSLTDNQDGMKISHGMDLTYNKRFIRLRWNHAYVQDGYNAEVGFVRRKNYISAAPEAALIFYPKTGPINSYRVGVRTEMFWKPGFGRTDEKISFGTVMSMDDSARLGLGVNREFIYLFRDFDPTGTKSQKLAANTEYTYWSITGFYRSDSRKKIRYQLSPYIGQYFNGKRYGMRGGLVLRYEPRGSIQLNYSVNWFDMPYLEEIKSTILIGPRIDYTFSKSVFTTLFVQYNSQDQNTNVNARLQWRFAPVSDFFLVYTDNYFTGNVTDSLERFAWNVRNRSIVAKLTYWFNV